MVSRRGIALISRIVGLSLSLFLLLPSYNYYDTSYSKQLRLLAPSGALFCHVGRNLRRNKIIYFSTSHTFERSHHKTSLSPFLLSFFISFFPSFVFVLTSQQIWRGGEKTKEKERKFLTWLYLCHVSVRYDCKSLGGPCVYCILFTCIYVFMYAQYDYLIRPCRICLLWEL